MVEKFKDAANILKAKFKKDDLQESLVQATSQENWQASTTLLHEIVNASYNYEKCQQINKFIWDKLKKKQSWRKILKTLNLVDFLLKNGPPSLVSSYKYEIYQFKSFFDYSHVSTEGIDRGESIRQKAKSIVQLLTNQEILEEERTKAKTIRERMSGITGGGYSTGDSRYQGYDSKNYNNRSQKTTYGQGSMNTAFGDYNYNQSTLDKYKDKGKDTKVNKSNTNQRMVEPELTKPDIITQEVKKPFQKEAPKLIKPGQKPQTPAPISKPAQVSITEQAPKITEQPKTNLMDDDIFGFSQPAPVNSSQPTATATTSFNQQNLINPMYGTTAPLATQNVQSPQQTYVNPLYGATAPMAAQNVQNQQSLNFINPMYETTAPLAAQGAQSAHMSFINPMYGTTAPIAVQQQTGLHNLNLVNPMYGTTAPMAAQSLQGNQMNYINPLYGTTAPMAANNYQQQQQQWSFNGPSNQMYGQVQATQPAFNKGITLSQKKNDDEFGNFQSSTKTNVAWLSEKEQGLIDFSDFGTQAKKPETNNNAKNMGSTWEW